MQDAADQAAPNDWFGVANGPRHYLKETHLYPPIKRFLEDLGFSVKGEVGGCDAVAISAGDPPIVVVCELKLQFNLDLVLQGIDRAAACDEVWLAARLSRRGKGREGDSRFRALCRRLDFGLLGVAANGQVEVLLSPTALAPRRDPKRRSRLVDEHRRRRGDPALGGSSRQPIMTAYRQEALACAAAMSSGTKRPRDLKPDMPNALKILRRNVYGWFVRTGYGIYDLTPVGREALQQWTSRSGVSDSGQISQASSLARGGSTKTGQGLRPRTPTGG
jgi:hypothetical protein